MKFPPRPRRTKSVNPLSEATCRVFFEGLESRQFLSASIIGAIAPLDIKLTPDASTTSINSTPRGYTPAQIRHAYGFDTVTNNGANQTIAIVDAFNDPNIAADLNTFDLQYHLSAATLTVENQTGGTSLPKTNADWAGETSLDVEWAHAIAPGAKILLVEANSDSLTDLLAAVNTARNAAGVSVVSMSWGGSEFSSETQYDSDFTTPAGHIGVTFVAASGDEGSYYGPEWPASSPNVLSVGGTALTTTDSLGTYGSETAWRDSTGGNSRYEKIPSYQSTIVSTTTTTTQNGRRVTGPTGGASTTSRNSPDVSYLADPNTGIAVYDSLPDQGQAGWFQVGGTSAGAPQWAALIAIADQSRVSAGKTTLDGATGTLPALYALYAAPGSANYATYTTYFNDISATTSSASGHGGFGGGLFGGGGNTSSTTATAGYDTTTGLGTPKAAKVIQALAAATPANAGSSTTHNSVTSSRSTSSLRKQKAAIIAVETQSGLASIPMQEHLASFSAISQVGDILEAGRTEIGDISTGTLSIGPAAVGPTQVFSSILIGSAGAGTGAASPFSLGNGLASFGSTGAQAIVTNSLSSVANHVSATASVVVDSVEIVSNRTADLIAGAATQLAESTGYGVGAATIGTALLVYWFSEQAADARRRQVAVTADPQVFNWIQPIND